MSAAKASAAHRILLVEDESTVLEFNTMVLIRGGYLVTAVEGCEAAWERVRLNCGPTEETSTRG